MLFILLGLTFKALNNQTPKYLCELISIKKPSRSLRSNTSIVLHRKKANTVTYGQRSFHHAAPELWNQLPSHVKNATSLQQFKSLLKAHLFSKWLCFCICILINMFVSFVKRTVVLWRSALNKRVLLLLLLLLLSTIPVHPTHTPPFLTKYGHHWHWHFISRPAHAWSCTAVVTGTWYHRF